MTISEIWVYPVKSLGGVRLKQATVEDRGFQYDRRWMIVDETGLFQTQRVLTKMALIDVKLASEGLILHSRTNGQEITISYQPLTKEPMEVTVFDSRMSAVTVCNEADKWLSEQLDRKVRLVMMPTSTQRKVNTNYAFQGEIVSFADGYPFMLISQASLDYLNQLLPEPVRMNRFRPNLVVSGTAPFEEDEWKQIMIGDQKFEIVKPCSRCILITVDPETGEKGSEPLKTLTTFRKVNNKILFGQNLLGRTLGDIKEGDALTILSKK